MMIPSGHRKWKLTMFGCISRSMKIYTSIFFLGAAICLSCQQSVSLSEKYLFYIPGGIVLEQGPNSVSSHFGPYLYNEILDTLRHHGFYVISKVKPGTPDSVYTNLISEQIDSLLNSGLLPENITVLGASAGAYITLDIALKLKNQKINYVILGMCWEDTYKGYVGKELCGDFLSIYEASDPHGSCAKIFEGRNCLTFKEIKLNMNNSHAFLYKPFQEWVLPVVRWVNENERTGAE